MLVLTIRTDKPEAELGLFNGSTKLAYSTWQAHRQLAETVHTKIKELLVSQNHSLDDLKGIVVYQGPGSFTGLRIGISVANALAYSLNIPITAATGDDWLQASTQALSDGQNQQIILPEYGAAPHITTPKK
jgi:tRNA threonylcarbamoyladenosine biosynthesis protein TsaB